MRITRQARREAKRLWEACLVDGRLEEERVRASVRETIEKKPRHYLPVLVHFARLVRLALAERQARVESAVPLGPALQAGVQEHLTRLYGPGLDWVFGEKPELIGGLRVQVGSDVYDGSIRSRLEALGERF